MDGSIIANIVQSGQRQGKYYEPVPATIPPETRRLFEEYVGIPPADVIPYLDEFVSCTQTSSTILTANNQRNALWDIYPWPCVGQFKFVSLTLHQHAAYPRVCDIVRAGGRFLDVGCAAAQDLRYLVMDCGGTSANTVGLDRNAAYIDTAYRYFRDRDTLRTRFVIGDLLDRDPAGPVQPLAASADVLHAGMLLHCWDYDGQLAVAQRFVELLVPRPGALALGNSVGRREGRAGPHPGPEGTPIYKHDEASFRALWAEVGRRTGTSWTVRTRNSPAVGLNGETAHWEDPDTTRLFWEVERE